MTPERFRAAVVAARETELDRIEAGPVVRAMAGGDPDPDPAAVLAAAASAEFAARNTFQSWAETSADADLRDAFAATAGQEQAHYDRVRDHLPESGFDPADGGPVHAYLRARADPIPRVAAGMVGRSLVSVRSHSRVIEFFDSEGDPARTDLFRDLRAETEDTLEWGLGLLGERCLGEGDWTAARSSVGYVVRLAHDDYADAVADWGPGPG